MVSPSLLVEQKVVQSLAMRYARRVRQVYRGYVLENGAIALAGRANELADNPSLKRSYLGV